MYDLQTPISELKTTPSLCWLLEKFLAQQSYPENTHALSWVYLTHNRAWWSQNDTGTLPKNDSNSVFEFVWCQAPSTSLRSMQQCDSVHLDHFPKGRWKNGAEWTYNSSSNCMSAAGMQSIERRPLVCDQAQPNFATWDSSAIRPLAHK